MKTPRSHARKPTMYGVGMGRFRRAVFSQSFTITGALFSPTRLQGDQWRAFGQRIFDGFVERAKLALDSFGGIAGTTYQLFLRYSTELTGRLTELWDDYQSGYKRPSTTRDELGSRLQGWGDADVYRAAEDGETPDRPSRPLRARPVALTLRALSPENNGQELPSHVWRNKLEEYQRAATTKTTRRKAAKGSTAKVREAYASNPSITNAKAYALFPKVPKPSIRRILNEARKK